LAVKIAGQIPDKIKEIQELQGFPGLHPGVIETDYEFNWESKNSIVFGHTTVTGDW
jgi:hypothetical protein